MKVLDTNDKKQLLNDFFRFKNQFMKDDSILDAIIEYSHKYDYDQDYLIQELADLDGFVEIAQADCVKFKYINNRIAGIDNSWD